jgi:hypothetical protein
MSAHVQQRDGEGVVVKGAQKHWMRILNGAIAGAVSKTVVSPLERVRLVSQTTQPKATAMASARDVISAEGWVGMWRGNGLSVARAAIQKAVLFSVQDGLRVQLGNDAIAGSAAGVIATLASYPLDLLRTRAAGVVGTETLPVVIRLVLAESGVSGLFRGVNATLVGAVFFEGTRFGAYGWLTERRGDHWLMPAINGTLASLIAGMLLYPNDTIRRRIQFDSKPLAYLDAVSALVREGGLARLYRGSALYAVKTVPAAAVQFGVYHGLKRAIGDRE